MTELYSAICSEALAQIVCGDSFELIQQLPDKCVDHVITDPPFDSHVHATHGHRDKRNGFRNSEAIPFEALTDYAFVEQLIRITRRWIVIKCAFEQFGEYRNAAGDAWKRSGVWIKPNGIPQFSGDRPGQGGEGLVFIHSGKSKWNSHGKHAIYTHNKPPNQQRWHVTEMPVPLCEELISDFCQPGELILDPFAGSAAVGHAVLLSQNKFKDLRYVGVELQKDFAKKAARRLNMVARGIKYTRVAVESPVEQLSLFGVSV